MFRWVQRGLLAVGLVIIGYCAADWFDARLVQRRANRELDRMLVRDAPAYNPQLEITRSIPEGGLIGKVEIPDLHLSAVVFQGTSDRILDRGVGHMNGTALPGQRGNVVLAAHRDSFFRGLRHIERGQEITVTTQHGPHKYQVSSTEIVAPTEMRVAAPTAQPELTLITCYPFYFVGHAPKRFIVHAMAVADGASLTSPPKEPARIARSFEPAPGRPLSQPENSADLTYVVRVSP